jgi:hypothetical protein
MRDMKRIVGFAAAGALSVGLTACSSASETSGSSGGGGGDNAPTYTYTSDKAGGSQVEGTKRSSSSH